jgi:hypothetical protein
VDNLTLHGMGSPQGVGRTRDIAADDESSNERRCDSIAGLVGHVVNQDHVEAVSGTKFAQGIDVARCSVAEPEVLAHNDALRSQALNENVAHEVGRTQTRKLSSEGEHKTGFDTGVANQLNPTLCSRDV